MEATDEQIRQIATEYHARKIQQANTMADRELFFTGADLFDYACRISLAGLRNDHPELAEISYMVVGSFSSN